MNNSKKKMLILATVSIFLTCAIVAQAQDDVSVEKVASVERPDGSVIEFYQVDSGPVVLLETSKAKSAQMLRDELDPTTMTALEIYKNICPGCEVPDALVAAHEETGLEELAVGELVAPRAKASRQIEDRRSDSLGAFDDACPGDWFFGNVYQCTHDGSSYDYEVGPYAAVVRYDDAEYHESAACSYRNSCDYYLKYWDWKGSWITIVDTDINEGEVKSYYATWGCSNFYLLSHVDCQASGGGAYMCGFGDPC